MISRVENKYILSTVLQTYFSSTLLRGKFGMLWKYILSTFEVQCTLYLLKYCVLEMNFCNKYKYIASTVLQMYFSSTVLRGRFEMLWKYILSTFGVRSVYFVLAEILCT